MLTYSYNRRIFTGEFMNKPNKIDKAHLKKVLVTMTIFIVLALFLFSSILITLNKFSASRTTDMLLNEVIEILNRNYNEETGLIKSLKEDYTIRAETVAYILEAKPESANDIAELEQIANIMGIDEINLFDENGVIYGGTVPSYNGLSFNSGIQMAYFKPMLSDKSLKMCQDVTPNTAIGKNMIYAITWCRHKDRMIQIGIEPVRLIEKLKKNNIENVIAGIPSYQGVSLYVSDARTGKIRAATDSSNKGKNITELGISEEHLVKAQKNIQELQVNGYRNYIRCGNINNYVVTVIFSTKSFITNFFVSLGILFIYLLIAGIIIVLMVTREERLINTSKTDSLTGLFNRRAYQDDIKNHNNKIPEGDYIYVSMDLNELKVVNDTLGHEAGDEILMGAADCMKRCFSPYGKVYRIGGDEFAAMIFATKEQLYGIKLDFENLVNNWKGKLVSQISVSTGYVPVWEVDKKTVTEIALVAERRMYDEKSKFYRSKGVDRRGQKDAHTALCALYTKILKINITNDTYQIVNMDEKEQTAAKGFSDKISVWLTKFGTSGQVHPEDLDEYLKKTNLNYISDYFLQNKNSLTIFYRRKYDEVYKQVVMEIIPATDYSPDNQNLFLYVKSIDK